MIRDLVQANKDYYRSLKDYYQSLSSRNRKLFLIASALMPPASLLALWLRQKKDWPWSNAYLTAAIPMLLLALIVGSMGPAEYQVTLENDSGQPVLAEVWISNTRWCEYEMGTGILSGHKICKGGDTFPCTGEGRPIRVDAVYADGTWDSVEVFASECELRFDITAFGIRERFN